MNREWSNLLLFWAKLGEGKYPADAHPAACHLLDVAFVSLEIWESGLGRSFRSWLAEGAGLSEADAAPWVAFWVGLHDLGKISPAFQRKAPASAARLVDAGFKFPVRPRTEQPHGVISTAVLPRIWEGEYGLPLSFGRKLADAIGGHHGTFAAPAVLIDIGDDDTQQLGGNSWADSRRDVARILAAAVGVPGQREWNVMKPSSAWLMAIAGLTSVADWIGSMEAYFPPAGFPVDWDKYVEVSRHNARRALAELAWNGWQPPERGLSIGELFPFISPGTERPLQVAIGRLTEEIKAPTLVVIEAPMGEGKTESAMLLADHWAATCQQRGTYFALPTMATSNQMFGRVRDFLSRRYPTDRVNLLLLHGRASLSDALRELIEKAQTWRASRIDDPAGGPGGADLPNLAASEWFTYRKRGLLAPFGVGTVDQVLLAVLQTKHVFVRLFGLAHKTIIVDEVHAYDAYMSTLLELLLTWLRSLGASVVLLSATLPRSRRHALLRAWQKGSVGQEVASEAPDRGAASDPPYPRISWIQDNSVHTRHFEATRSVVVDLKWRPGDLDVVGSGLRQALSLGGCAAVICNTVGKAQKVYLALKKHFEPGEIDLFHARYPFEDREARENRTLDRFGKADRAGHDTTKNVRPRRVVVATQVIEQSLDIDFDLMVTELAPVDLLLQRAGRLHRHVRARPADLTLPVLWVLEPDLREDGSPNWGGSGFVYAEHILWRSWLALRDVGRIRLPEDIEPLIDAVYDDDRPCPDELPPTWKAAWESTRSDLFQERAEAETQARQRLIKPPAYAGALSALTQSNLDEDDTSLHQAFQAMTRLGPPSVSVVCLFDSPEGLRQAPDGGLVSINPVSSTGVVGNASVEKLIRRSVSLTQGKIVRELIAHSRIPREWGRTTLLRQQHLLKFDAAGRALDVPFDLFLDPDLGLMFRDPSVLDDT